MNERTRLLRECCRVQESGEDASDRKLQNKIKDAASRCVSRRDVRRGAILGK